MSRGGTNFFLLLDIGVPPPDTAHPPPRNVSDNCKKVAEELYFFKIDPIKARSELFNKLKIKDNFTYSEYLERNSEKKLNYIEIISRVNESIELLSRDEFWSISYWIYEKVELENSKLNYKDIKDLYQKYMFDCGMELFYEIPSKTPVR